jgi:hypothetical protein
MEKTENSLSIALDEPACWGSGELPLLPSSWLPILKQKSVTGLVLRNPNQKKKQPSPSLASCCSNNWVAAFSKWTPDDESKTIRSLIISQVTEFLVLNHDRIDLPIFPHLVFGLGGGTKLPLRIETRVALIDSNNFDDLKINTLLCGTYYEMFQKLGDLEAVLDLAITASAWATFSRHGEASFREPKKATSIKEAFEYQRLRTARSVGISPLDSSYTDQLAHLFMSRLGLAHEGKWTFAECGAFLGISAEGARRRLMRSVFHDSIDFEPRSWGNLELFDQLAEKMSLNSDKIIEIVDTDGLQLEVSRAGAESLLRLIGRPEEDFLLFGGLEKKLESLGFSSRQMRAEAYRATGKIGFIQRSVLSSHFQHLDSNFNDELCNQVINHVAKYSNLINDYVYIETNNSNFVISCARRILSLQGNLTFEEFYLTISRYFSGRSPETIFPARSVIRDFLLQDERFSVREEIVGIIDSIAVDLGKNMEWLRNKIIASVGLVIHKSELLNAAREEGFNATTVQMYSGGYAPYFKTIEKYYVTLVGSFPSSDFILLAKTRAASIRIETSILDWSTKNKKLEVSMIAGSDLCNGGWWSPERTMVALIGEKKFEMYVDGESCGVTNYFGGTSTSWNSGINALRLVPGENLLLSFDLLNERVNLSRDSVTEDDDLV